MRIISGKYKGRTYFPPKSFRARPTTDFAKENLFNVLNNRIDWVDTIALDLFGGTGGISYELVSRGCEKVTCVENDFKHAAFIKQTKEALGAENLMVFKMDVFRFIEREQQKYDFIFVDPPYDLKNFEIIPSLILSKGMLAEGGLFILEHSSTYDFSSYHEYKEQRVYGSVNFTFFEKE